MATGAYIFTYSLTLLDGCGVNLAQAYPAGSRFRGLCAQRSRNRHPGAGYCPHHSLFAAAGAVDPLWSTGDVAALLRSHPRRPFSARLVALDRPGHRAGGGPSGVRCDGSGSRQCPQRRDHCAHSGQPHLSLPVAAGLAATGAGDLGVGSSYPADQRAVGSESKAGHYPSNHCQPTFLLLSCLERFCWLAHSPVWWSPSCAMSCFGWRWCSAAPWSIVCSACSSSPATSWWSARCLLIFQSSGNLWLSLIATGLVAALFQPVREQVQRFVNQLLYGERAEPYKVIAALGQRLEATFASDAVLPTIAQVVQELLQLPYVAIALDQDGESEVAASAGTLVGEPLLFPLTYQGASVGAPARHSATGRCRAGYGRSCPAGRSGRNRPGLPSTVYALRPNYDR